MRLCITVILMIFWFSFQTRGQTVLEGTYERIEEDSTYSNFFANELGNVKYYLVKDSAINTYTICFEFLNGEERIVFLSVDTTGMLSAIKVEENRSNKYQIELSKTDTIKAFDAVFWD